MNQIFIHPHALTVLSQRYLNKLGLNPSMREEVERDLLTIEGCLLNPTATVLDLNAFETGAFFNNHVEFLQRLALHVRALAHAESNVALHTAICSECTTARERRRLIRLWDAGL